jgi:hypothetical protein
VNEGLTRQIGPLSSARRYRCRAADADGDRYISVNNCLSFDPPATCPHQSIASPTAAIAATR